MTGMTEVQNPRTLWIDYTNYRGERSERQIVPLNIWFGTTEWHPKPCWLMKAFDCAKQENRNFAMEDIHKMWTPKSAEEMQLSGHAVLPLGRLFQNAMISK